MANLANLIDVVKIFLIVLLAGWAFRIGISIIKGDPIEISLKNPLKLKARWPKTKENE